MRDSPASPPTPLRIVCLSTDPELRRALDDALAFFGSAVHLQTTDPAAPDAGVLAGAHALICGELPASILALTPSLRWVQLWGADDTLDPVLWENGVQVATCAAIHAVSCAEHVLALMLAFSRALLPAIAAQQARDWAAREAIQQAMFPLDGKTVGIVGAGRVGQAIGARCRAFGMRTLGLRRHPDRPTPGMDAVVGPLRYHDLLLESDFVVLALPLTPETRWMFGEDEIEILKKSAYVFNIGRGGLIDERYLIQALQKGWIAGAGLDVFEDEPLPPNSPLWRLPNCILTPHVGGGTGPRFWPHLAHLVAEQTARWLRGEPLADRVAPDHSDHGA